MSSYQDMKQDMKQDMDCMPSEIATIKPFGLEYIPKVLLRKDSEVEIEEYLNKLFSTLTEESKKLEAFVYLCNLHISNISQRRQEWLKNLIVKYGQKLQPTLEIYRLLLSQTRDQKYVEIMIKIMDKEMPFMQFGEFLKTIHCIQRYGAHTPESNVYNQKLLAVQTRNFRTLKDDLL